MLTKWVSAARHIGRIGAWRREEMMNARAVPRRSRPAAVVAVVGVFLSVGTAPVFGEDGSDLAARVEAQQKQIEELRREVESLQRQKAVTPEDVDRRIEEFETAPESRLLIAGYGTVQYEDATGSPGSFGASLNPGFHFRMAEWLHINAEPEFTFRREGADGEATTDVDLEFVQIDYLATDWLVLSAGKILVPFNVFGPRLHPGWINRMASAPILYGGHEAGAAGLIPMVADFGLMVSGGTALWSDSAKINYAFYVTNGPDFHEEGEVQEEDTSRAGVRQEEGSTGGESLSEAELLELEFESTPDLNTEKAFGGRLGFLPVANLEVGASYMTGQAPDTNDPFHLVGADAWYAYRGLELRGEYMFLTRKTPGDNPEGWGYWVQGAFRLQQHVDPSTTAGRIAGRFEPVIRWGDINGVSGRNREQLAVGLNYWVFESAPLKFNYEHNTGAVSDDRIVFQFAYGF